MWRGRSVFVTGGTGLMGGWVVRELLEAGADVVALVRDHNPRSMMAAEGLMNRVNGVYGSLEDADLMKRALAEYGVDTVFHLAAQPLVGVAKIDPVGTLRANVAGTWNVLEAARLTKVKQVVVASSDKAYGSSDQLPYREHYPLQGAYPYDASKSCTDIIANMYAQTYGMAVGVARCANLYGGGDLNFSRTFPGVIKAAYYGERFQIRSDGKFVRDFLYVKDAADAYLLMAEAMERGVRPGAVNFSIESRLTVLECADLVLDLMGRKDLEPEILNQASNEIREQYLSCEKAATLLGWKPRYSLRESLRETIHWYTDHFRALEREASRTAPAAAV
ncbi:MAG: NAD-dependent epimerase/dehydratase family protein [Bryobacterales bacterium]|nr:NAD-dependent epimerase/dehydratase family protein [Bryobacterales bacterium]